MRGDGEGAGSGAMKTKPCWFLRSHSVCFANSRPHLIHYYYHCECYVGHKQPNATKHYVETPCIKTIIILITPTLLSTIRMLYHHHYHFTQHPLPPHLIPQNYSHSN